MVEDISNTVNGTKNIHLGGAYALGKNLLHYYAKIAVVLK